MNLIITKHLFFFTLISALLTNSVYAIDLEFSPGVFTSALYSDNLYLDSSQKEDIVTEISPKFNITGKGNRTDFTASYRYRYRNSYQEQLDTQHHIAETTGKLDLIKNYLTIIADGRMGVRSRSYTDTKLINESDLITNLTQYSSINSGIKFDNHYKKRIDAKASYIYRTTQTEDQSFIDTNTHTINAILANGKMYHRFIWSLSNHFQEENISIESPRRLYFSKFKLGYNYKKMITPSITAGYEKTAKTVTGNSQIAEGYIYLAALDWTPNSYLRLFTEYGERAYGEAYLISLSWTDNATELKASHSRESIGDVSVLTALRKNKNYEFQLTYKETLTTHEITTLQEITEPEGSQSDTATDTTVAYVPLDINNVFKRKRFTSTLLIKGQKNAVSFGAHVENRDYLVNTSTGKETGIRSKWILKLDPKTSCSSLLAWIKVDDEQLQSTDEFKQASVELIRNLNKKINVSMRYVFWERNSSKQSAITNNKLVINGDFNF